MSIERMWEEAKRDFTDGKRAADEAEAITAAMNELPESYLDRRANRGTPRPGSIKDVLDCQMSSAEMLDKWEKTWSKEPIGTDTRASTTQEGGTHYKTMGVQPWDVVDTWPREQQIGYYRGGALKYIMRMGSKDQEVQEIKKGQHYMRKLLEILEGSDDV